jgi:hypothetical protein
LGGFVPKRVDPAGAVKAIVAGQTVGRKPIQRELGFIPVPEERDAFLVRPGN